MKLVIALSLLIASVASAAPRKFNTLAEMRSSTVYYVSCTGKQGRDSIHISFSMGYAPMGGLGVKTGGIAIIAPGEGMYVHTWETSMFQMDGNTPGKLKISGTGYGVFPDTVEVRIEDATNGRFPATIYFNDRAGVVINNITAVCTGTNYAIPIRQ